MASWVRAHPAGLTSYLVGRPEGQAALDAVCAAQLDLIRFVLFGPAAHDVFAARLCNLT